MNTKATDISAAAPTEHLLSVIFSGNISIGVLKTLTILEYLKIRLAVSNFSFGSFYNFKIENMQNTTRNKNID